MGTFNLLSRFGDHMTRRTRPYREVRQARLLDPVVAAEYLNAAREESTGAFLKALFTVAQARQMSKVAKEAGVQRETLYHALSEAGNPRLDTFMSVLSVLDIDIKLVPKASVDDTNNPQDSPQRLSIAASAAESYSATDESKSTLSGWFGSKESSVGNLWNTAPKRIVSSVGIASQTPSDEPSERNTREMENYGRAA